MYQDFERRHKSRLVHFSTGASYTSSLLVPAHRQRHRSYLAIIIDLVCLS